MDVLFYAIGYLLLKSCQFKGTPPGGDFLFCPGGVHLTALERFSYDFLHSEL